MAFKPKGKAGLKRKDDKGRNSLFKRRKFCRFTAEKIEEVRNEALKTPLQGIVAALEGMKIRNDREVLLHFSPYPILLILGKKDGVLNYEDSLEQIENTKVELVSFPDGHMSHIENEAGLKTVLVNFLKKI